MATVAASATDPAERERIYFEIQQLYYDEVPTLILAQETVNRYEQRWVQGYYWNPILPGRYFYAYSLAGQ